MAVKQSAEVTIIDYSDADHFTTWYRLTTSPTLPSAPVWTRGDDADEEDGGDASLGWSKTEPGYSVSGGTPYLYECLQTVWGDGSCEWGAVQLSTAFEAAKSAYNEALVAARTATSYFTDTTNGVFVHAVGGDDSTGWSIQDVLELLVGGQSLISAGLDGNDRPIIRIGPESGGMHLSASSDRLAFCDAGGTEVASIAVDAGNNSKLYISEAVVMSELNFGEGKWTWRKRENDNLSLKWTGA